MTTYSWLQAARLCARREPDLDIQPQVLLDLLVEGMGEPWGKPFPGNAIMHELLPARALRGARIELRMRPPFTSAQRPIGIALVLPPRLRGIRSPCLA